MYKEINYTEVGKASLAESKRSSQIAEQLETQAKLVEELSAMLDTLDNNLQVVSRAMPTAKGDSIKPTDQLVPLAETLRSNNNHIISLIDRVRDMISELEL